MVVLKRTGNVFRDIGWEEYKTERLKDKDFSHGEELYFKDVINYCKSAEAAQLFSKEWSQNDQH